MVRQFRQGERAQVRYLTPEGKWERGPLVTVMSLRDSTVGRMALAVVAGEDGREVTVSAARLIPTT